LGFGRPPCASDGAAGSTLSHLLTRVAAKETAAAKGT